MHWNPPMEGNDPDIFAIGPKLVLRKKIKTQQDFLKLDDNFHKFIRKREFYTFSVLKV